MRLWLQKQEISLRKIWNWFKDRLGHKLEHFKLSNLMDTLMEHGMALVVIMIGWEIIEDILFPMLFIFLGQHVHPAFYVGAPASWLLCLHWLAVPILWGLWVKISKKNLS